MNMDITVEKDRSMTADKLHDDHDAIKQILLHVDPMVDIYPSSIHQIGQAIFCLARIGLVKRLVVVAPGDFLDLATALDDDDGAAALVADLAGETQVLGQFLVKCCPLTVSNSLVLRRAFPFTNPVSLADRAVTIGLGDRLGLASPGHIRIMKTCHAAPVLAQQSIRELNLTGRTYADVLAAVVWAVFQEDYTDGYGADGDHLKTAAEVRMALDHGYTMITLDCSEQIDNAAADLSDTAVVSAYAGLDEGIRRHYEARYADQTIALDPQTRFQFTPVDLKRTVLIYHRAIQHARDIFLDVIQPEKRPVDFELSIDETRSTTSPAAHYLVAAELVAAGVRINSLAPRFYGEFQKGVDYRGDIDRFTAEFDIHVRIARAFGYKVSVHSGSDKFSVFPVVGALTDGRYHLKTAGTNWLEAMHVIAEVAPDLYRRMHAYALSHLDEARRYYHVSCDPARIPALETVPDDALAGYFGQDDARQLIHITYGLLLQAQDETGAWLFRDAFFETMDKHEQAYMDRLARHIGRHLRELGL
jgi:hypothetical protein